MLYKLDECQCHPGNSDRTFILTDFGFARPIVQDGKSSGGHGSNSYRDPALIKEKTYSDKTDIWAFGCVMIEVASSGRRMAFNDDYIATKYHEGAAGFSLPQLEREDNTALDDSSRRYINSLVKKCLERNPEDRPSAKELLDSLVLRQG